MNVDGREIHTAGSNLAGPTPLDDVTEIGARMFQSDGSGTVAPTRRPQSELDRIGARMFGRSNDDDR